MPPSSPPMKMRMLGMVALTKSHPYLVMSKGFRNPRGMRVRVGNFWPHINPYPWARVRVYPHCYLLVSPVMFVGVCIINKQSFLVSTTTIITTTPAASPPSQTTTMPLHWWTDNRWRMKNDRSWASDKRWTNDGWQTMQVFCWRLLWGISFNEMPKIILKNFEWPGYCPGSFVGFGLS